MAKTLQTKHLEMCLYNNCQNNGIYGCEEITIGFAHNGHGNEICDFITMDSRGTFRCYEIKVTMADFHSKAHLSWYGHYNYIMVPKDMYESHKEEIERGIPGDVGICTETEFSYQDPINIRKKSKRRELSNQELTMISQSVIRSMGNKIIKLRGETVPESVNESKKKIRRLQNDLKSAKREVTDYQKELSLYRHYYRIRTGKNISDLIPETD